MDRIHIYTCKRKRMLTVNTFAKARNIKITFPTRLKYRRIKVEEKKLHYYTKNNKAVLEPCVSPAVAITFFCIHCNILDLKIHQSMWIHWPFFPKTWTKGHWPLDDLWPHVCWGHMCDSTQGSLCPSPMTIHQCMWIQWSILQNTTYIHIHTYILHTTYRMSDHIVSYWTQFSRDKNPIAVLYIQLYMATKNENLVLRVRSTQIFWFWEKFCF